MSSDIVKIAHETAEISKSEARIWEFGLTQEAALGLSIEVREGPSVDTILVDSRGYGHYL